MATQLANFDYYKNTFKGSKIQDLATFDSCCMEASRIIGNKTLQKVFNQDFITLSCVQDCACAIADLVYQDSLIVQSVMNHEGKEVSSEKVGEYSVSYNNSTDSRFSEKSIERKINYTIISYLSTTNLLYRGGYVC